MSRCLAERSIDHVLLERGEVAHSWRTERWDSLRLLTPNWQSRLPGFRYDGNDPDGYRTLPEVVDFIAGYAKSISAPVRTHTTVTSVRSDGAGYLVRTDRGDWRCRTVVLASGACNIARVPSFAGQRAAVGRDADRAVLSQSRPARRRRRPGRGRLVERHPDRARAPALGAPVTLSVGEHIRAPRLYRGKDLEWWMDAAGVLDERYDQVDDIARARRVPSLQLAGTPDRSTLDLNALSDIGVRLVGRLAGITEDGKAQFAGSLRNMCALSDLKMRRLLDLIDEWARANGLDGTVEPPDRLPPTRVEEAPAARHGPRQERRSRRSSGPPATGRTIPGWSCRFSTARATIRHDGGIVSAPGVYLMGMQFLRRRKSALIDGAGDDARDLSAHLSLSRRHAARMRA